MTGTTASHKWATLWSLCVVLITTSQGDISCPKGGRIHLVSQQCYWLSDITSSWFEAQVSCRETWGGDLASAESQELLNFIHHSFSEETTVWVWLRGLGGEGPDHFGIMEPLNHHSASQGLCPQMALGTPGKWRRVQCAGRHSFICKNQLIDSLPSIDNYLTGLLLMTGVYTETHIHPLPSAPDIGQHTVEMLLFPGLWFSHAGQLVSVELVVHPSPVSSLARVQILRPYCSPTHHLVPPGCSSLLNPYSCCSTVPLCNTTGGCSMGYYWCHLLEGCVPTIRPCSTYDSTARDRSFTLPPRYSAFPPFYHLVADLPLRINPSSELKTLSVLLPERAIMVYPDDIVAVQHTLDFGTFLHCLDSDVSRNSPWRQSYLSLRGSEWGGWWEGGLTSVPQESNWVDGAVCDLRILYVDKLHRATEHEDIFDYTHTETTTAPDIRPETAGNIQRPKFRLHIIHPIPDEKNQIHVQINVPTVIVVKALFGQKARSSWSAPVLRTGVPFHQSCPEKVDESAPDCKTQSHDDWFSSVTLVLPLSGVQTLNISVMDADSFQSVSVEVHGYEPVTGLSVEPRKCLRILIHTSQLFKAKVDSGSSVKFTWVIDSLEKFAYEGESYSVMFKQPAEYQLRSQQILLTADEMTPQGQPEFMSVWEVVAVDAPHVFAVKVNVDISLPVTFKWDFGDGSSDVIHTQSAPCQTIEGLLERQVYVQDSVNHTYSTPEDYTLHVQVSNQYGNTDVSMKVNVRPQLSSLVISSSTLKPLVRDTLHLEASVKPFTFGILYTWDFNDGSKAVQGMQHKVSHSFGSAGVYNITACASNTVTSLTASLVVIAMENISGLVVTYSGPDEAGSPTDFRAKVASGTSLIWYFNFGDGSLQENVTDGSVSHVYTFPGNYSVGVTVSNSVSQAYQSITVEVYSLIIRGVLPVECIASGKETRLTALVNGNISKLTFHWMFEEDPSSTVVVGQSTAMHIFPIHGIFHVNLTVSSSVSSASFSTSICVESPITDIAVQSSQNVVAVRDEVCITVLVSPKQATGYQFRWFINSSDQAAMTENSQRCFVFRDDGVEEVSVMARNKVSNKTAKVDITIQNPVSKLSVAHDGQSDTLIVNASASFWVASCAGSNVSVLWDFGDGSPMEQKLNVSHVFTSSGKFTITAKAFNAVSQDSATLTVNVLLPVSDLSLHTSQPYAAVGEETLFTAKSSGISTLNYYWEVQGVSTSKQGTYQFRFTFSKPGVYRVRVMAQNLVSKREAAILIEVFERVEGLQIECQSLFHKKYIPTHEEMLLIASVSKGSNITYHWLATQSGINQQLKGEGELFHVMVKTPGRTSVQLTASNILGEATTDVSFVAVERVTSAHIASQSNTVALGKAENISVFVDTGSDLQYLWYVNGDVTPLLTLVPFFLYTFTSLGQNFVRVSVQNILSQSIDSKQFLVQEEVQKADFVIDGKKHPFFVNASAALFFKGLALKGNDLHWDWKVRSAEETVFTSINPTFIFTFPQAGIYLVYLNVSNQINWQGVSHGVTVQEAIEGLLLNMSMTSFCTEERVTFIPVISTGSNASFVITFQNDEWIQSQGVFDGQLTMSGLPAGKHLVTLKAMNQVSDTETSSNILVTESIQGLRLVNCCLTTLEALKGIQFKAEVQRGFHVNYTWEFHLEGSHSAWLMGREVTFTPPESGLLSVSVQASNGVCSQTINETATIEWPVKNVKLFCHVQRIFVGHAVRLSAAVDEGSDVKYVWDFGDYTKLLVTNSSIVSHTYYHQGKYSVVVKALNNVSLVSAQLQVDVEELLCSNPKASLVQTQSTIFRSRQSFFEASVDLNCSAYKTRYLWEIFREQCFTKGDKVNVQSWGNAASPLFVLPKHALSIGCYCLVFTVSFQGTPLLVQQRVNFTVVHSPVVAVIEGGSHRLWSSVSDLVLDGSESHDPDVEPGVEDTLQYHWAGSILVTVTAAPVLPVAVKCVSCSLISSIRHISYHSPVILAGQCGHCDDRAQYKWTAEDHSGLTLDLNDVTTSTGRHSPNLVVHSGVLQPGQNYSFALNVFQPGSVQQGSASLTIQSNSPPRDGLCDLSPEADIHLLETTVTYNCSGWQDNESGASQLIYTFQVASCQPISTVCPLLTLYRGTRSTFSSLVPMGSPGHQTNMSVITVTLLIEDHMGVKFIALNRTLTVKNPVRDEVASQWFKDKIRTELWALVQHGNPQEIIPYSIALTSKLNQEEFGKTAENLMERREIRENVTQALISLPLSSLEDVDQLISALMLSVADPSELLRESCQKGVLEVVGKMILVIEQQKSPAEWSAVDTGRNILNVIGSILAAVSESVSGSSSNPAYTNNLQAASEIALSALGHAGALMHILMHSHVHGEAPLLLSSNYIRTVGFLGDPVDLLCTQQSNQTYRHQVATSGSSAAKGSKSSHHCQFHIPTSLSAHLKSQSSEVVQVLYDVDGALNSNPLMTAANPPISTNVVAMELSTPQGQPILIQDLDPEQAIRVTLPNKYPMAQGVGDGNGRVSEAENGTCLTVTLPSKGQLNFTVKALEDLEVNAGLYISFNFTLAPGAPPVSLGHVKVEVIAAVPETNASQHPLLREWAFSLSAPTTSSEETIFLSPISLCQYYSVKERRWRSDGLRPLEGTTLHTAHCLTQHLTMFGASLFIHPGAIILLPPSGPMRNIVAGIVCAVLVLLHLLVGLISHKLDHLDSVRLSQVPLCGRPGLYHYRVLVKTGWRPGAGTTAHVGISLYGVNKSGSRHLQRDGAFQRGSLDQFQVETDDNLGEIWKIRIWHDNTGLDPSWYVQHVVVWDSQTDHMFFFLLEDWLSVENESNSTVEREFLASCPEELTEFRRVLTSQLMFGMVERHLWLSLWELPSHSCFTRGQRVTCCSLLLHLYLALGALWYGAVGIEGHSVPVSTHLLVNMEMVAVGMGIALLVFPLQCFLCFLFRRAHSQVTLDMSVPPSPVCHSVEMDVYLGQSDISGPSFLSLPESSGLVQDSPTSLLESKALDSSILDFWAASGLVPQTDEAYQEEVVTAWPSSDSLVNLPAGFCPAKTTLSPGPCKAFPAQGPTRQLRRKKALMKLHLSLPTPSVSSTAPFSSPRSRSLPHGSSRFHSSSVQSGQMSLDMNPKPVQVHNHKMSTLLTLSEEDLLMSIAAAEDTSDVINSNSDSGWDSPRTTSLFSTTQSTSWSSCSEGQSEDKSLYGAELSLPDPQPSPTIHTINECSSVLSVESVASTFLPGPPHSSTHSSSSTRIGVARGQPSWVLPSWALCVIYPVVAVLLGACLAVVGLYGSLFSRTVLLMWLLSALSAFLTSVVLLEPIKVCVQALICTALWRPVDPEVEEQLDQVTTVVSSCGEPSGKVRPPCGYGLLQAKEEARKIRALHSLMRHCVCQLLFLLLVLMVNYQDKLEQRQGRLLHSTVKQQLRTAPLGSPNLTSLRDWSDTEQWINHTLVPHLHQNPTVHIVGLPRLQCTRARGAPAVKSLGNNTVTTRQLLADMQLADKSKRQFRSLSIDFTHYHRESGLFICVSIELKSTQTQGITSLLSIHPVLIPSSFSGPDLHVALAILLLISALLIMVGELWSMVMERARYIHQYHHWFQLLLAFLSLATAVLQLCFLSLASSCVSELRSKPDNFINFHSAAFLAVRSSQSAAVLLTLLVLKLLGTLRFVRRWVTIGRVLQRAWRELLAVAVLILLLLVLCTHLGNTLFSHSVEDFLSGQETGVSVLSVLRGRTVLQKLCRVHPALGPLYGLLLMGGSVWLLARLCGTVLIRTYREEQAGLFHPTTEPQDYEMVEFFIKRLKLWMGITKAKQFRHRVKFEGMDIPLSRASQESCFSILSSTLPSSRSSSLSSSSSLPRPLSLDISVSSDDLSVTKPKFEVQPYLDNLEPIINNLLYRFDRVNHLTEDTHDLEIQLEEAQARRRKRWISNREKQEGIFGELGKPKEGDEERKREVRHRKVGRLYPRPQISLPSLFPFSPSLPESYVFPRVRNSYSESESVPVYLQLSCSKTSSEAASPPSDVCGLSASSIGFGRFPRRAWHSGSSHSADVAQRAFQPSGDSPCRNGGENLALTNARPRSEEGVRGCICDGLPPKRKAWISEGLETEQD
ncbi:polycystin-1 [Odontesthes bonariensis]|uniref:polycystin-1 n=1 Tax=Odontesthes bonariensis TaxID=219752 RepID=UPI003F5811C9